LSSTNKELFTRGQLIFFSKILPILAFLLGVMTVGQGIQNTNNAKASDDWPSVSGEIIYSQIKSHSSGGMKNLSTSQHAVIKYRYKVANKAYIGNRTAFGASDSSNANDLIIRYPEKKPATIYYKPESPGVSVLEPGSNSDTKDQVILGLAFMLLGIAMLFIVPRFLTGLTNLVNS